ncbi:chitin deacetylase [Actinomortierella ambigua]|uniref:Chitin deacetylase n=1 Tax=Actinomortierella ambigua TaxID=1343610 RepID=A0A9P6QFA4_9FUNG|nr:chitin deacetylase [Actinomortierella ambigua]
MRCSKRIPLILSVLALPLILSGIADAGKPKDQKKAEVHAPGSQPEQWQLRAHGHSHLYAQPPNNNKKPQSKKKQNLRLQAKKPAKKSQKKLNHKRAVVQAIDEDKKIAGFEPELWQLRAYGHNHQQKAWSKMAKDLAEKAPKKKVASKKKTAASKKKVASKKKKATTSKKLKSVKKKAVKRAIPLFLQDQLLLKLKPKKEDEDEGEVEVQHGKHGKGKNPEDDEHGKYNDDDADDATDSKKGGDDDKKEKKKKKGGFRNDNEDDADSNLPDKGSKKDGNKKGDKKAPAPAPAPAKPVAAPAKPAPAPAKPVTPPAKPVAAPAKPPAKPPAVKPVAKPPVPKGPAPIVPVQAMGEFITKCNTPGQIALTYAEGPSEATTQMLDILREGKARVTFFANATWLQYMQYAGVTRKAYNEGHLIGMTYRLPNDSSKGMTDAQIKTDVAKTASTIHELVGIYPKYVRLHEATAKDSRLEALLRKMGYLLVGFNLDEADYKFTNHEQAPQIAQIYETTFSKQAEAFGRKGSYVVVGYDIPATGAAAALPGVIQSILTNEYDMVRLDGCLNDPAPYKKSPTNNDGYIGDDFSFSHPKYVHGQSPVAVQNGHPIPGKMPDKTALDGKGKSIASAHRHMAALGFSVAAPLVAALFLAGF